MAENQIDFVALVVAALVVAVLMLHRTEGANHTVGDTVGWRIPPNGASMYSDWASKIYFQTGDILVFKFATGSHDVAVVTKDDYDACNTGTPVDLYTAGPTTYSLDVPGDYYFICTQGGGASHCLSGQKLAITVADSSSSGPTSSPPSSSSSLLPPTNTGTDSPIAPPPPKDSKACPSLAASLSLIFISLAMSFVHL